MEKRRSSQAQSACPKALLESSLSGHHRLPSQFLSRGPERPERLRFLVPGGQRASQMKRKLV